MTKSFGVIGAGVIGLATARALGETLRAPVTVLEKEHSVAVHQSGRNSGVVHAGLYYQPGSLKARLCRQGVGLLRAYCDSHGLAYEALGKVVVATSAEEVPRLDVIAARAHANGVPGLRRLDPGQLAAVEPHVRGLAALYSPETAVVDFRQVAESLAADVHRNDGRVRLDQEVLDVAATPHSVVVRTAGEEHTFDHLVVCAGLQSDRFAGMLGAPADPAIVPFRGEYFELVPEREHLVRALIYPVPDPQYPFLGVHFTRGVHGGVHVGPNAVPASAREGYRWRDLNGRELAEVLRWPGARTLARRHWRMGAQEIAGSVFKEIYYRKARRFVPDLRKSDLRRTASGVRAQALRADGTLEDDFAVNLLDRVTLVRNAPSPAATSSLAIGQYLANLIADRY